MSAAKLSKTAGGPGGAEDFPRRRKGETLRDFQQRVLAMLPDNLRDQAEADIKKEVETVERVSFNHKDIALVETVVSKDGYFEFVFVALRDFQTNGKVIRRGDTRSVPSVNDKKEKFVPAYGLRSLWETGLVKFPSAPSKYGPQAHLVADIKAFICRYANIPERWLELIAHYILMTWVYDKFSAVPYLRFLGEPGTGKTRLLQVAAALCYKATVMSGNVTGPALFRTIALIQGTLVVDEVDFKNSAEWSDIVKVLNNGYTPGFPIVRCDTSNRSFEPQAFRVYGPKVIGTRSRFADHALETRCLTFETKESPLPRHIPMQLPLSFEDEARALRNKLLHWRFDNYARITVDESKVRHLDPRLGQVGASLYTIADAEARERLVAFLNGYSEEQESDSPRALVVHALVNLRSRPSTSATVGEIASEVNNLATEQGSEPITAHRVGRILRSMGLQSTRKMYGYSVDLDTEKIAALCQRYGMNMA